MLENYNKALRLLFVHKELFEHSIACSDATIVKVENTLGVKFPYVYRLMLRQFGCINFGGTEIYGIYCDDISRSNMLDWSLNERNNYGMPSNLVIIHELGDGTRDCLQINENDPDESPVVEYHDPDSPVRVLAPDFGTFLLELVQQEIKFQKEEMRSL